LKRMLCGQTFRCWRFWDVSTQRASDAIHDRVVEDLVVARGLTAVDLIERDAAGVVVVEEVVAD